MTCIEHARQVAVDNGWNVVESVHGLTSCYRGEDTVHLTYIDDGLIRYVDRQAPGEGLRTVATWHDASPLQAAVDILTLPAPFPPAQVGDRVSTAAELNALPSGVIIVDPDDDAWQKSTDQRWNGASASTKRWTAAELADLDGFTVVYIPTTR
ncbi:hypothetical protein [Rhodococcus sp. 11-3]|uniref:hypothetical protein n=1 Tax=Rhodococcus sp. 11-3 TaxID=2854796 RepID=UPI00203D9444|nr:hypothetical protein [Rhodococcus sp. 11-3]USC17072.1 hypothetical protein KZJ41_09470 [Rhodococcus sp. 11-3]